MDTARGLKVTILALIACAFLVFALDNTIRGCAIVDVLFAVAYIAAIAVAWLTCKEDGRIGPLPVAAIAMTTVFGAEVGMLINDINVAIYWWDTLSGLPDPGRRSSTLVTMVLMSIPLLLITTVTVKSSSPKRDDDDGDSDNKG